MGNSEQFEMFLRALLALGLGAAIGLEREFRGHEAGIRTIALVCAGAAVFGAMSDASGDTRIAASVVQGIGFLGAGIIFQRGHAIRNVTTAATIWVGASVGLLVGMRMELTAMLVAAAVIVLLELGPVSDWVYANRRPHRGGIPREDDPEVRGKRGSSVSQGDP